MTKPAGVTPVDDLAAYCRERFEPDERDDQRTHTCNLPAGHEPPHTCPLCGNHWEAKS